MIIVSSVMNTVFANEQAQLVLDEVCENARKVALKPKRKEIYLECRNVYKESSEVCMHDALAYDGIRGLDKPLHYDLPACVEAAEFREQNN